MKAKSILIVFFGIMLLGLRQAAGAIAEDSCLGVLRMLGTTISLHDNAPELHAAAITSAKRFLQLYQREGEARSRLNAVIDMEKNRGSRIAYVFGADFNTPAKVRGAIEDSIDNTQDLYSRIRKSKHYKKEMGASLIGASLIALFAYHNGIAVPVAPMWISVLEIVFHPSLLFTELAIQDHSEQVFLDKVMNLFENKSSDKYLFSTNKYKLIDPIVKESVSSSAFKKNPYHATTLEDYFTATRPTGKNIALKMALKILRLFKRDDPTQNYLVLRNAHVARYSIVTLDQFAYVEPKTKAVHFTVFVTIEKP